jgi:Zn-finger nucleic acid-binding protein
VTDPQQFKCPECDSKLFCAQMREKKSVVMRWRYCKACRGVFLTRETVVKKIQPDALLAEQLARKGLNIA